VFPFSEPYILLWDSGENGDWSTAQLKGSIVTNGPAYTRAHTSTHLPFHIYTWVSNGTEVIHHILQNMYRNKIQQDLPWSPDSKPREQVGSHNDQRFPHCLLLLIMTVQPKDHNQRRKPTVLCSKCSRGDCLKHGMCLREEPALPVALECPCVSPTQDSASHTELPLWWKTLPYPPRQRHCEFSFKRSVLKSGQQSLLASGAWAAAPEGHGWPGMGQAGGCSVQLPEGPAAGTERVFIWTAICQEHPSTPGWLHFLYRLIKVTKQNWSAAPHFASCFQILKRDCNSLLNKPFGRRVQGCPGSPRPLSCRRGVLRTAPAARHSKALCFSRALWKFLGQQLFCFWVFWFTTTIPFLSFSQSFKSF